MYGEKIRMVREVRNFSQEYVAEKIGIKQNSYSKIESNQTKLTADMLQKIVDVFQVSPMDIMSQQPAIINFQSNNISSGLMNTEHHYNFQKELMEKMIASKDQEIADLKSIIDTLLERRKLTKRSESNKQTKHYKKKFTRDKNL